MLFEVSSIFHPSQLLADRRPISNWSIVERWSAMILPKEGERCPIGRIGLRLRRVFLDTRSVASSATGDGSRLGKRGTGTFNFLIYCATHVSFTEAVRPALRQ